MNNIKKARLDKELTQEELARKCKFLQEDLSRYENGRVKPSANRLLKLSKILNVSIDMLLKEE